MKKGLGKAGVPLFLVAVMILATILVSAPVTSQAAAKGTTYTVVIQTGSPLVSLVSINNGASGPQTGTNEGITFQMVVETKAKTEKVKSTKGSASYYPVTILKKSFKVPVSRFPMVGGGGMAKQTTVMAKDAKGKLYISGGDVDVSQVMGEKKLITAIGDGIADLAGSMIIPISTVTTVIQESDGKAFMTQKMVINFTTGKNSILVKGSKSGIEGKRLPDDGPTGYLPKPMVGQPLNLDAGTGTLVGTTAIMNLKVKILGELDLMLGESWMMKISK